MKTVDTTYIFDFDRTIVSVETLDVLAEVSLQGNEKKEELLGRIKDITEQGMNGSLSFGESLKKRFALLSPSESDIKKVSVSLKKHITPSILRNKKFFKKNAHNIYIVSGGFAECIIPIATILGISKRHVYANTFVKNRKGNIVGYDARNPMSKENGKVEVVKKLKKKNIVIIGDGFTDSQIKAVGAAKRFVAFTEHVERGSVMAQADEVVKSFDEFLFNNKLPMTLSYPKSKIKVVLLENIHPNAASLFKQDGFHVEWYDKSFSGSELDRVIGDAMILGIRSRTKITKELFLKHPKLRTIGAYCIGVNQIDLSAATNQGVAVFNAPFSNTRSVVELAIGEMIMLMRGTFEKSTQMHSGIWNKSANGSKEMRGKTLGIVGYGHIGTQLSVIAEALGMRVVYYDVRDVLPVGSVQRCHTLKELLKQSDIVTIHVDGRAENRALIGANEFALMKKGALFLNLSRGFVVDAEALYDALKRGHLRGAAVDVFPSEPKSKGEEFVSPLRDLANVILTPHIAGSTEEAQYDIGISTTKKLIAYINSGCTEMSVNMPSLSLPLKKGTHRLVHIHANVPGILAQINSILAEHKMNIEQQSLKTNEMIGYVITDVNKKYDQSVLQVLQRIPNTIRFRTIFT
jgi:D-3-phosphoglycerate dehydrogenase